MMPGALIRDRSGITRDEIEQIRRGAMVYHLPTSARLVVMLCDVALGLADMEEVLPRGLAIKPERY